MRAKNSTCPLRPSREWLKAEYGSGKTAALIAVEYGVSDGAIHKWLKAYGIPSRGLGHGAARRAEAVGRRKAGRSIRQVAEEFGVSTSTATVWTRHLGPDVRLPPHRRGGKWRAEQAVRDRESFVQEADRLWPQLSTDPRFMFGLALYIGEGDKSHKVGITNCDPGVIRAAIVFFTQIGLASSRLKVRVHVHSREQVADTEAFWQKSLNLPASSFTKTIIAVTSSSKRKRGKIQPYGCAHIGCSSVRHLAMITRWSELAMGHSSTK